MFEIKLLQMASNICFLSDNTVKDNKSDYRAKSDKISSFLDI